MKLDCDALVLTQRDQPSKIASQGRVPREVVVGEEVVPDVLLSPDPVVRADVIDDVVGAATAHRVPLHVDDRAERAVERTAATGVDRAVAAHGELPLQPRRDLRQRHGPQIRQIFQEIVQRLQPPGRGVLQQARPRASTSPSTSVTPSSIIVWHSGGIGVRHGDRSADVEPADHHVEALGLELPREILRARKLIRLHAGERDEHLRARPAQLAAQPPRIDRDRTASSNA